MPCPCAIQAWAASDLHLDLLRPIRLPGLLQAFAQFLQLVDVGLRGREVAASRGAQRPRKVRDRFGLRELAATRLQLRRTAPILAFQHVARRYRRKRRLRG